jgi:hypothetical protein
MKKMKHAYFHRVLPKWMVSEAVAAYQEPINQNVYATRKFTNHILSVYNTKLLPIPPLPKFPTPTREEKMYHARMNLARRALENFPIPSKAAWMGDEVIDAYLDHFLKELGKAENGSLSLELMGVEKPLSRLSRGMRIISLEMEHLADSKEFMNTLNKISTRIAKRNRQSSPVDFLILSINQGSNHWVCCKIDKVSKNSTMVTYVDSFGKEPTDDEQMIFLYLANILAPNVTARLQYSPIQSQDDGWSCGLHMMWNTLCLIHGFEKTLGFRDWVSVRHNNMLGVKARLISDFARVLTKEITP